MSKSKLSKAVKEVDRYLDSLPYNQVINERADRLYERIFHDIAGIALKYYEDLDVTANTELSVTTDTTGGAVRVLVTGYIKVSEGLYLQIEKVYLPKEYKDELETI